MTELKTNAEKQALKATELPAFQKVALQGLKNEVAAMLNMIGHTNDVFATYTKHDISHIDAMLKHLDWLIPPSTQTEMTPVDWILATLAIYFHDLGMLVTADEFEKRMANDAFVAFLEKLKTDPKSQDYLNRANKMTPDQKERFFFQEFIREQHASRIKEWITGRHSRHWGVAVKPIAEAIAELMKPFPARFRENLATVSESHHRDNLNKLDLYPLGQRYGNETLEMANVQYAALILRTVDLIHVTKDRTPSIMYKTINLSDPKGVDEWDKQKDTFAVRHAGRMFLPDDQATHVITVSADFTEERPFFALTEYLAWADGEIKQTKRWSDQSRAEKDGANFWFPWQAIRGDLRVEGNEPQQMRFEFDRGRLLNLLIGHAIYNDATVAIRELLQNAIDAVRFQHHLLAKDAEATGKPVPAMGTVKVTWDRNERKLVIEDEGTGMDLDIIKFHLMRVGSSFYDTAQFASEYRGFTPISRFGIGVLTCFMISDDVEIITFKKNLGQRIRMTSVQADYLLRDLLPGDEKLAGLEPHGTRVTLTIREGGNLNDVQIEQILRYWVVLPACRVEYIETGKTPVRIGFDSPAQTLKSYYEEAVRRGHAIEEGIEIISKQRTVDGGSYEMAIAVKSGWLPEGNFAALPLEKHSAFCIEGINVSEALPGFASERAFGALISVRGVRSLRTTVSRSDLEQDEEFIKVGKICAEMLFEHIEDELKRIAAGKGKPLSRASTAGKWLCGDLLRPIVSQAVQDHVIGLRRKLPLIVMELSEDRDAVPVTERQLVSPESLVSTPFFWIIESRLVDSLGIISRDLGRELSLVEFLNALAPDYGELRFSPILPDAHLFSEDITENHYPSLVQFSRRYQQTAIKWVPGDDLSAKARGLADVFDDKAFSVKIRDESRRLQELGGVNIFVADRPVGVAELSGDETKVSVVQTRIVTVLRKETEVARVWGLIQTALRHGKQQKKARLYAIFMVLGGIFQVLISKESRGFRLHRELGGRSASGVWSRVTVMANEELRGSGLEPVPEAAEFITSDSVFDASSYWRDWHRTDKG